MAHGYYNLKGEFVTTSSKAAATDAWRKERGYSTGGVYDVGGGEVVDTREVARVREAAAAPAPATPAPTVAPDDSIVRATSGYVGATTTAPTSYDVQGIQSLSPTIDRSAEVTARAGASEDDSLVRATSGYVGGTTSTTPLTDQLVRATSGYVGEAGRQLSEATPTEQAAAQGGGVPAQIDPYFADLSSGMQYLYSQFPENVGGVGTPTELRAGGGYGPSSYQWSESPASIAQLQQGQTPVGPALAAATTVETFLAEFGVRPEFVTSFVTQSLGLTPSDMMSMGYVQDLYGRWIALDFGDEELVGGSAGVSIGGSTGGYGGVGGGSGYGGGFRSGYTSGLINWRIGF